jgi:hypothetical protein
MTNLEPHVEKKMLGRLKVFGCILLVFSVAALFYNLIFSSDEVDALEKEIAIELEEEQPEPLNTFFVSTVFTIVGTGIILISWKKKKNLFSSSPEKEDPQ